MLRGTAHTGPGFIPATQTKAQKHLIANTQNTQMGLQSGLAQVYRPQGSEFKPQYQKIKKHTCKNRLIAPPTTLVMKEKQRKPPTTELAMLRGLPNPTIGTTGAPTLSSQSFILNTVTSHPRILPRRSQAQLFITDLPHKGQLSHPTHTSTRYHAWL